VIRFESSEETEAFGARLGSVLRRGDVVGLEGELGAGKTVVARGILRGLGFNGEVASPTFPIVLVYDDAGMALPAWHVDLYRIEAPSELDELGLEEARSLGVLIVEWPERTGRAMWQDSLRLRLDRLAPTTRALTAIVPPAWGSRWPPR